MVYRNRPPKLKYRFFRGSSPNQLSKWLAKNPQLRLCNVFCGRSFLDFCLIMVFAPTVFWISASLCFLRAQFSRFLPHYGFCGRSFLDSCAAVFWIPAPQFSGFLRRSFLESWALSIPDYCAAARLRRAPGAAGWLHLAPPTTPLPGKGTFTFILSLRKWGGWGAAPLPLLTTTTSRVLAPPEFWWSADILLINNRLQGWNRKSIPLDRESVKVLKSILPCWGWENEMHHTRCYGSMGFHISYSEIVNVPKLVGKSE